MGARPWVHSAGALTRCFPRRLEQIRPPAVGRLTTPDSWRGAPHPPRRCRWAPACQAPNRDSPAGPHCAGSGSFPLIANLRVHSLGRHRPVPAGWMGNPEGGCQKRGQCRQKVNLPRLRAGWRFHRGAASASGWRRRTEAPQRPMLESRGCKSNSAKSATARLRPRQAAQGRGRNEAVQKRKEGAVRPLIRIEAERTGHCKHKSGYFRNSDRIPDSPLAVLAWDSPSSRDLPASFSAS